MLDYLLSLPSYIPMLVVAGGLAVSLGGLLVNQKQIERKLEGYVDAGTDARAQQQKEIDNLENRFKEIEFWQDKTYLWNKQITSDFLDLKAKVDQLDKPHNTAALANIAKVINKKAIQSKVISKKQIAPVKPRKRVNGGAHVSR